VHNPRNQPNTNRIPKSTDTQQHSKHPKNEPHNTPARPGTTPPHHPTRTPRRHPKTPAPHTPPTTTPGTCHHRRSNTKHQIHPHQPNTPHTDIHHPTRSKGRVITPGQKRKTSIQTCAEESRHRRQLSTTKVKPPGGNSCTRTSLPTPVTIVRKNLGSPSTWTTEFIVTPRWRGTRRKTTSPPCTCAPG